jgi:FMN phosphatase YigB (HAD superfamily)
VRHAQAGAGHLHAAESLGLEPEQCVFIDDIEANVAAAAACGMTGVHHTEAAQTAAALRDLLGVPLSEANPPPERERSPEPDPWPEPDLGPGNTMR